MELQVQAKFSDAATVTSTGFLADCIDRLMTTGPGPENQLDPLGVIVGLGAIDFTTGDETYQVQLIEDIATNGTTAPVVVADTGTMKGNDVRLTNGLLFLPVSWNLITDRYLMVKLTLGGTTPSIAITGAWLGKASDVPNNVLVAANFSV